MIGDEATMQQHVAVDEHEVVAARSGEREVSKASDPEAQMRLLDVLQRRP